MEVEGFAEKGMGSNLERERRDFMEILGGFLKDWEKP